MNRPSLVEEWREIPDWPEYVVSSHGRVKRVTTANGAQAGKVLQPGGINSYLAVTLSHFNQQKRIEIHVLVAAVFLGPRPKGFDVNHKDLNKKNNVYWNLEYMTRLENIKHALKNGAWGSRLKLTEKEVLLIRSKEGGSPRAVAKQFNVAPRTVRVIWRRETWRYL